MAEFILVTEYEDPYWQILVNTSSIEKITQRMDGDMPATYLCRKGGYSPLRIRESMSQVITALYSPIGRHYATMAQGFGGYSQSLPMHGII